MKLSSSRYSQCLYFSSGAFARKVEKLAIETWQKIELAPSHAYILMMVLEEPGAQPSAIAREMMLTPSTITRLIERLEEKKLVVRIAEGKIANVYATPKAKALYAKMKILAADFSNQCGQILGAEEHTRMVDHINKLTDKIP